MSERKIMSQIASSNADFHPIIRDSKLSIEDKLYLQEALVNIFDNDFRAMIDNMLEVAIEREEYDMSGIGDDDAHDDWDDGAEYMRDPEEDY